jgi:general secretion pathway protein B
VPSPAAAAPQKNADADAYEDVDSPSSRRTRRSAAAVIPQPVARKQLVQNIPAPADIKLSGIAWQDERSGRRAVINGFLLKEGAVVSGAKIVDIQADRVRFSSPGGPFEIRLDAVLPAEVK